MPSTRDPYSPRPRIIREPPHPLRLKVEALEAQLVAARAEILALKHARDIAVRVAAHGGPARERPGDPGRVIPDRQE